MGEEGQRGRAVLQVVLHESSMSCCCCSECECACVAVAVNLSINAQRATGGAGSLNYLMQGNKLVVIADYVEILEFMRREPESESANFTYQAGPGPSRAGPRARASALNGFWNEFGVWGHRPECFESGESESLQSGCPF